MRSILAEQRRLFHMLQTQHKAQKNQLEKRLQGIQYELQNFDLASATPLLVQVLIFENEIVHKLDQVTSAVLQDQFSCLLLLLLSSQQLNKLLDKLKL